MTLGFLVRRLAALLVVIFLVSVATFFAMRLVPGDPARLAAGPDAPAEAVEALRAQWGLNQPLYAQLGRFLRGLTTADLGVSYRTRAPVWTEVRPRILPTLLLTSAGMSLALVLGVIAGVISAIRRGSWLDTGVSVLSTLGISLPVFWLGILLMMLFAARLRWVPSSGWGTWKHLILPAITLGVGFLASTSRMTRSSMLEVLRDDYIRTAIVKGLPRVRVLVKHALRNPLLPIVTIAGLEFGRLLGGAVITESVFAWPGMDRLMVDSVKFRDYPTLQACGCVATKTLNCVEGVDITTLDPAFATDRPTQTVLRHLFENLVDTDPATGGPKPWLASAWKVSDDKKTWTFQLRSGVRFSDGTPLNGAAVKFTLERLLDAKLAAPNRTLLGAVVSIQAPSDTQVVIQTKEPFAPLLENLAHPGAAILPPGFDPNKPIGSGPYKLEERQNGIKLVLNRNPQYSGTAPTWEQIVYKPVPEAAARTVVLESGEAQIVNRLAPESVADLKGNNKVEVLIKPSTFQISFEVNNRLKPFDDPRVRRALNLAVDKEALVKGPLRGMGSVPVGPVPAGAQWPMTLKAYPYSPDEAKKLLAEAGVKPGTPIEIWTTQGRYTKDKEMAEAVSGYLQAVGFAPTIKVMEWGVYSKAIEDPKKTAALYILGSSVPTLDWRLTRNFLSTSTNNYSGYKNDAVDKMLLQARAVFADAARKELYDTVQTRVWDDAPYLFLFNQVQIIGVQKGLSGLTVYGHEILDVTQAKVGQ